MDPVLQNLELLEEVVGGMTRLIEDLLAYTRAGAPLRSVAEVELESVMLEVEEAVRDVLRETEGRLDYDSLPRVRGDRIGLLQVLQNLVANALKYRGESPPEVSVAVERGEGEWRVRVEDNGLGMDEEASEQVFDPFYRGHDHAPGSGLGLATCRRVVERHGGRIWIDSHAGAGTVVEFTLPV